MPHRIKSGGPSLSVRRAAGLLGLVGVLVLVTGCHDWTGYMGNPALNGSDTNEHAIGIGNVASLAEMYTVPLGNAAPTTGVTVSGSRLFAASLTTLIAADLNGTANCAGPPTVCQPLWTAPLTPESIGASSQPLVRNGVVYESSDGNAGNGQLAAYDANGTANCSGTPVVCQALWTANVASSFGPNVDGGTLFITDYNASQLEAFDASGVTNCAGTPKVCQPLWTAPIRSSSVPSVAGGKVYVTSYSTTSPELAVYDEAGATGCSGSPRVCQPLFTAPLPAPSSSPNGSVDVSGGVAYLGSGAQLVAVDATGTTNCSGSPTLCQPLWTAYVGTMDDSTPAVAGGRVYVAATQGLGVFWAFDASGTTNCAGTPKVCHELFSGPSGHVYDISPVVTNGLVFAGGYAWDATGVNCPVGQPCTPIWHTTVSASTSATVAAGTLLLRDAAGTIHAYRLP